MNMQNLMAQAQRIQRDITKKQEEIYSTIFEGESEWIKVTVSGKKEIQKIEITYTGDLNDDKDMLSDMITIAINNAYAKIDKEVEEKMGMYSKQFGGLM